MENEIVGRLWRIPKGSKIAVYPLSTIYGDMFTAIAVICFGLEETSIELSEPFQGVLENFDGTFVYISSEKHHCLKIDVNELKDVVPMG